MAGIIQDDSQIDPEVQRRRLPDRSEGTALIPVAVEGIGRSEVSSVGPEQVAKSSFTLALASIVLMQSFGWKLIYIGQAR